MVTTTAPLLSPRFVDSDVIIDPYPVYERLRREDPVHWHTALNAWVLTRYEDCNRVLRDCTTFTTDARRLGLEVPLAMQSVQSLDPPEHEPLRTALVQAFAGQDMAAFRSQVRADAVVLLSGLDTGAEIDLVADFTVPLALRSVCRFLGVPAPVPAYFDEVSNRLVAGMDAGFRPEAIGPAMAAREELSRLAGTWLDADLATDGFLARLRALVSVDTEPLVLRNTVRVLLHAGYSSTSRFIENALKAVLGSDGLHPGVPAGLRQDSGAVVSELLRFDGPVQAESRLVLEDVCIGGQDILRGDVVTIVLGAASRDPAVFDNPNELNLARRRNRHLGFGRGVHSCLGSTMAQSQALVVLELLAKRFSASRVAGPAVRRPTATLRGLQHLPAVIAPGPARS